MDGLENALMELTNTLVFLGCSVFALDISSHFASIAEWVVVVGLMSGILLSTLLSVIRSVILAIRLIKEFRRALRNDSSIIISRVHPMHKARGRK